MERRTFIKSAGILAASTALNSRADAWGWSPGKKPIHVTGVQANFEREALAAPFGFKGNYLTELWQTVSQLRSENGNSGTGLATQSVLYADSDLFVNCTEAEGNALMFLTVNLALKQIQGSSFTDPITLMDRILPDLRRQAVRVTGKKDLNINFLYNALVSTDNAAWLLYARENGYTSFDAMIPPPYRKALSYRNEKVALMSAVSYNTSMDEVKKEVDAGYFVLKIKMGAPGSQEEMLQADMEKLSEIHRTFKDYRSPHSPDGKLIYTLDANGRYEKKVTLERYFKHARSIGALDQILLCEEPFAESNSEQVGDLDVLIVADESVHDPEDARRKLELGYGGFVLKGIAKTLSQTLKIAKLAEENNVPCACADLTVNPILVDWNKNLAARLKPFPGLDMGLMETNGNINYADWTTMEGYHPFPEAPWRQVNGGAFHLGKSFFETSGGILTPSRHYTNLLNHPTY